MYDQSLYNQNTVINKWRNLQKMNLHELPTNKKNNWVCFFIYFLILAIFYGPICHLFQYRLLSNNFCINSESVWSFISPSHRPLLLVWLTYKYHSKTITNPNYYWVFLNMTVNVSVSVSYEKIKWFLIFNFLMTSSQQYV